MAPTSRGRGGRGFGGRGRGRRGSFGARRHDFTRTRILDPETAQNLDSTDSDARGYQEADGTQDLYSSSEDDKPDRRQKSYNALLQMLDEAGEEQQMRKKRKVRNSRNDWTREAPESVDGHLKERVQTDLGQQEAGEHNGTLDDDDQAMESAEEGRVEDEENEDEMQEPEDEEDACDPFGTHFANPDGVTLSRRLRAINEHKWRSKKLEPSDGMRKVLSLPEGEEFPISTLSTRTVNDIQLKAKLVARARKIIPKFDALEQNLASHIFTYEDVLFGGRTPENAQSVRYLACLHTLNHVLKTRDRVIKNNARLSKDADFEVRDQGFTRPKILILLPTRQSCVKYVETMMAFLQPEQQENKHRFLNSYSGLDQWDDKPADFRELFSGNNDDMFRFGLKFTRKNVKYFSQFYNSEVIFASPLGLRTAMEKPSGPKKEDHDFLSSIEVCIVDQADALLMQNWQHTLYIFSHLNLLPKEAHNTDFSRVRAWYLDGHAKNLRQTIIFSTFLSPDINSLFSTHLQPVAGKVKITPLYPGAILSVPLLPPTLTLKQTFSRFPSLDHQSDPETRLTHFRTAILPSLLKSLTIPTLVFVPTHPVFLSLRNYLSTSKSTSSISFASISEYTSVSDVARARSLFVQGRHSLLLYTERAHHFRRYKLRGVKRIVMLGLPENWAFYGEIVGMLGLSSDANGDGAGVGSARVLFSKWDALKLERVVGTERLAGMLKEQGGDTFEFV